MLALGTQDISIVVGLISLKAGHYDDKGYLYILSKLLSNGVEMTRK